MDLLISPSTAAGSSPGSSAGSASSAQSGGTLIGTEKAKSFALAKVPGADSSAVLRVELDRDDGVQLYEVKIRFDGVEHELDIDGYTGAVRAW